MPRQTFATREFFVDTLEANAYAAVQRLPGLFSRIRLLNENQKLHCFCFLYEQDGPCQAIQITVSVLPLNNSHTKITVHGSYTNGCAFYKDVYVTNAVVNVQAALQASIDGSITMYEPVVPKKKLAERYQQLRAKAFSSISTGLKKGKELKPAHS